MAALQALEQRELSQALALRYYGQQAAALQSQQRRAHYFSTPFAAFGMGRPGTEAQEAIGGGADQFLAEQQRHALSPYPGLYYPLLHGRASMTAMQRIPFMASGGVVPGAYAGVADDVPAHLTKGEYVFSRPAVQALGMGTVERIHRLARGGAVRYLQEGGPVEYDLRDSKADLDASVARVRQGNWPRPSYDAAGRLGSSPAANQLTGALASFNTPATKLASSLQAFGQNTQSLAQAFNTFIQNAHTLVSALQNFSGHVTVQTQGRLEVIHNGNEMFAKLEPSLQAMVQQKIDEAIRKLIKEKLPDA